MSSNRFSTENQPETPRGRNFKTRLFDAIRSESLLGVPENASSYQIEKSFLQHLGKRAFDSSDSSSHIILKELLKKSYPGYKTTLPVFPFNFNESEKPHEKAESIMQAACNGKIPPDVANILVQSIKNIVEIEQAGEIKERVEQLEAMVNGSGQTT